VISSASVGSSAPSLILSSQQILRFQRLVGAVQETQTEVPLNGCWVRYQSQSDRGNGVRIVLKARIGLTHGVPAGL
jgi:hypothetical protein